MNKNKEYGEMFDRIAKNHDLSEFDKWYLDTTYQAVSIKELDHVIENTTSKAVQDFALAKKLFYASKAAK
jgi:hypothetical protein